MKSSFSLILFFSLLVHVIPLRSDFQSETEHIFSKENLKEEKIYVPLESLRFSNEGIFLSANDQWFFITQLGYDINGYYLSRSSLSSSIATCNHCGFVYHNEAPQPCRNCGRSAGLDIYYEDIWDRNG